MRALWSGNVRQLDRDVGGNHGWTRQYPIVWWRAITECLSLRAQSFNLYGLWNPDAFGYFAGPAKVESWNSREWLCWTFTSTLLPSFVEACCGLTQNSMFPGQSLWALLAEKNGKIEIKFTFERERSWPMWEKCDPLAIPCEPYEIQEYFINIWNPMPERNPAVTPSVHQSLGQIRRCRFHRSPKFLIMEMEGAKLHSGQTEFLVN